MRNAISPRPARSALRSGISGIVVGALVWGALTAGSVVGPAESASAATGSAVTVTAREQDPTGYLDSPTPDLTVTVSQTQDLVQQGIEVSWTGGVASTPPSASNGGRNFLQVFQCWGDDPANSSRPDRTTCQYGGAAAYGATRDASRRYDYDEIPVQDQQYSAPRASAFVAPYTSIPFRGRNGVEVSSVTTVAGKKVRDSTVDVNNNQFFNVNSTNEVSWAGSGADGSGSIAFEVQTTMQSPGLGCGNAIEAAGSVTGAACWLVILPRGVADNGSPAINESGLFWESWQHAIAVRIGFEPVGARCPVGAAERQLAGSEVASLAVQSWQPLLCQQSGGGVFSHLTSAESDALSAASTTQDAPLALTTYAQDGQSGLVYAPVALSGIVVTFAIDRNPSPFRTLPDGYAEAARLPFEELRLTPRLVAKLLTNSYWRSLPPGVDRSYLNTDNPENITLDPDFLAINSPEWAYQLLLSPALADAMMPQGRSDAAKALWAYVMSDPEGAAFMAGQPDPYGMTVNPWYVTVGSKNASGTEFSANRDNFPKADPAEVVPPQQDPINVVTWRPYVNDLDASAYLTLRGDGQVLGDWDPNSTPAKYKKGGRSLSGFQRVLGISDSAAADRYEVRVASLRNAAGQFVTPTETSLLAAAAVMQPASPGGTVVAYDSASAAAKGAGGAYPLAVPVYAAATPSLVSGELRTDYADFIRYAVTKGQVSGVALGELPKGYAPIPSSWAATAEAAAKLIESGASASGTTSGPTTASTPSSSGSGSSFGTGSPAVPSSPAAEEQPDATGEAAPVLSGAVTPADPDAAVPSGLLPMALLVGLAAALAAAFTSRRKAVRTWGRR